MIPDVAIDTENISADERKELLTILAALRAMRKDGGWGKITIIMRGGDINELFCEYSIKTRHLKRDK
jgi:hypothetical protein